ncbi:hypothetical protein Q9L58_005243 [Maublancomyces gigas]|uniref:Uncharacterized protein n=1 Tax=Discina gigas TaxID=1032678 RepID=A0ABR3GIQ7_9PEZI
MNQPGVCPLLTYPQRRFVWLDGGQTTQHIADLAKNGVTAHQWDGIKLDPPPNHTVTQTLRQRRQLISLVSPSPSTIDSFQKTSLYTSTPKPSADPIKKMTRTPAIVHEFGTGSETKQTDKCMKMSMATNPAAARLPLTHPAPVLERNPPSPVNTVQLTVTGTPGAQPTSASATNPPPYLQNENIPPLLLRFVQEPGSWSSENRQTTEHRSDINKTMNDCDRLL